MKHLLLPDSRPRRLPFYLAMEEWVAAQMPAGEWFFTWRVSPTVIFGRNQQPESEVDLDYCSKNGIEVYRRKSGGGCVYADRDNIMLSFVSSNPSPEDVAVTFARYTERIAAMLRSLGLDATATGRNDVLIGGKKVSGNAFYHLPGGRSISHGTMLFSTDMGNMLRAITPSKAKLESKKVTSVSSHITTVSEYLPSLSIEDFERYIIDYLTTESVMLTPEQIKEIEDIEEGYYTPSWLWGAKAKGRLYSRAHIDGVGEVAVYVTLHPERATVEQMDIQGDFFPLADLMGLADAFLGHTLTPDDIANVLGNVNPERFISGLSRERMTDLLLEKRI